ncbi:MAG: hypothetical protein ABSG97_10625, partial [Sedimentisphaerales bacterium]
MKRLWLVSLLVLITVASAVNAEDGIIINNVSDSPDGFSPNGDGSYDVSTINYLITTPGSVTVKVYDDSNNL